METKTNQNANNGAKTIQGLTQNLGNSSASEITEVVKRKPLKGEYLNAKGQVFPKSIQNEIMAEVKSQGFDGEDFMSLSTDFIWHRSAKGSEYWRNLFENTDYSKLKNVTQQKRVELIETQKWELIAATATIDNQKLELEQKQLHINDLILIGKEKNAELQDLTERNGNLKTLTNDQTERIEFLEHENKNYESAIRVIEINYKKANESCEDFNSENKWLKNEVNNFNTINRQLRLEISEHTESRERLASKFTNWFIFFILTNIVSIAWGVYQLLTK